jgi:hypothetical protein
MERQAGPNDSQPRGNLACGQTAWPYGNEHPEDSQSRPVCYCAQSEHFGVYVHFHGASGVEGRLLRLNMRGEKVIKAIKAALATQSQTTRPVVNLTPEPAG